MEKNVLDQEAPGTVLLDRAKERTSGPKAQVLSSVCAEWRHAGKS